MLLTPVRQGFMAFVLSLTLLVLGAGPASGQDGRTPPPSVPPPPSQVPPVQQPSMVVGRVIDKGTGKPLLDARVTLEGRAEAVQTSADGRYRIALPPGMYSLRAALIGYGAIRKDSVRVVAGQETTADFALSTMAVELPELASQSPAPIVERASSDAGLLAAQKAAPTVMDGISAESMNRSPDSDASDAITRVTGASVVGDKYVYVRGLGSDRYGNTLLNGSELPSPEPLKKVVPLDLFPASLLQSIVTTKAGRPDRPGDVTGAGIEIQTKDFPEHRVLQFSMTQEYNSQTTFKTVARGSRSGSDFLGFDNGRRMPDRPLPNAAEVTTPMGEQFAESFRTLWTPAGKAPLNLGLNLNVGGTISGGDNPFGGVMSLNYSAKTEYTADRLYQLTRSSSAEEEPVIGYRYRQTSTIADWGAILNFSKRLGTTQLNFRNLYSRNAEETFLNYTGFNFDNSVTDNAHGYQVQYVERDLLQSQLSGMHYLPWLFGSRLEWRSSLAFARRDEPENRNVVYAGLPDGSEQFIRNNTNFFFLRFLNDRLLTGQADWAIPISLWESGDGELKFGVLRRQKRREFEAQTYTFRTSVPTNDPLLSLPPNLLFAPENVGGPLEFAFNAGPTPDGNAGALSPAYHATDDMTSGYVMADIPMYGWLRLVGGLRIERWNFVMDRGSREQPAGTPILKNNTDALWSTNLTFRLNDRMNIRMAGYRSVARPEARELDDAYYVPVGGECGFYGNSSLVRTTVNNADIRWELYPSSGEVVTFGGFYKGFINPIFEEISFSSVSNCSYRYRNAESATIYGLEAEVRRRLNGIGLPRFTIGANVTLAKSQARVVDTLARAQPTDPIETFVLKLPFIGQSPYLLNFSLTYATDDGAFSGTALLNYFDDRIQRYGDVQLPDTGVVVVPSVRERGRTTLDVKVQRRLSRLTVTGSGKNLLNTKARFVQEVPGREYVANAYTPGVSLSVGLGYDF